MNKYIKSCFTLISILLTGSALAAGEPIEWQNGKINPGNKVSINFDRLDSGTAYNLECRLSNNDVRHKGKSDIKVITNGKAHVFVNEIDTEHNSYVTLMYPVNSLTADNIKKDAIISIYNLNPFNTINIYKCTAISVND